MESGKEHKKGRIAAKKNFVLCLHCDLENIQTAFKLRGVAELTFWSSAVKLIPDSTCYEDSYLLRKSFLLGDSVKKYIGEI